MININECIAKAMKSKNQVELRAYKNLKAEIQILQTAKNAKPYDEAAEIQLISKMCKKLEDSISSFIEAGREDLATEYRDELEVLKKLLPEPVNEPDKWDWYCEGGRWGAWLLLKEKGEDGEPLNAIFATKEEVDWDAMLEKDRIPFCFVTEDGDWHESASMGWWAMTTNDKDEDVWRKEFLDYLESVEDDVEISVIDFHI